MIGVEGIWWMGQVGTIPFCLLQLLLLLLLLLLTSRR